MAKVTNEQWAKLFGRAALKEDAQGFISFEFIQALLEGRLMVKASLVNYAELRNQFDWAWDGYSRVMAIERIEGFVPAEGPVDVDELELVHLGCDISPSNARVEIAKQGMNPATTLEELLAYAKKFPEKQLEFKIVVLGEVLVVDGRRYAPGLDRSLAHDLRAGHPYLRGVSVFELVSDFHGGFRFLARKVRK